MARQKSFEELTFADNYMFTRVMRNLDDCKELLEILLKIKITEISIPESEATLAASYDAKSIRLDVRTSDPEHEYDIEMQTTDKKDLPLRARYYQSLMDIESTQRGTKYKALKQNVVIFICLHDPFDKEEPVYTFKNTCAENSSVEYHDKMMKVFYNCEDCDKIEDTETRAFLKYVATKQATTDYTERLEQRVRGLKVTPREQLYYNNWLEITDDIREEARAEAREEGRREGREEGRREGHLAGIAEGEKRGAHNKAVETARNLLKMNLTIEQISSATKLSLEEIAALQNA